MGGGGLTTHHYQVKNLFAFSFSQINRNHSHFNGFPLTCVNMYPFTPLDYGGLKTIMVLPRVYPVHSGESGSPHDLYLLGCLGSCSSCVSLVRHVIKGLSVGSRPRVSYCPPTEQSIQVLQLYKIYPARRTMLYVFHIFSITITDVGLCI